MAVNNLLNLESVSKSFDIRALLDGVSLGVNAVIESVSRARPAGAKGKYLQNCVLSATFSPGIPLAVADAAAGSDD